MAVTIKEARTRKELKQFIQFGIDLYKGNECFCPPLIFDEMNTLDKSKNPAFDVCEAVYYMAYKDGKLAGRIAGIVNNQANTAWNVKKVRFGWFDFIDDKEVSKALLDAVAEWGKSKGMDCLNGPVGFTDMDHQGLLIKGYEYLSPMAALYNYPYYVEHFEQYGMEKEADWVEVRVTVPEKCPERMERVAAIVAKKYNLRPYKVNSSREVISKFGTEFFDVIDQAYQILYNYSPLTDKQKRMYTNMYMPLLNYDFVSIIVDENDKIVAVGIAMPNISKALRKCNGKLLPLGWYHLLKDIKRDKVDILDLLLIAVRPDYQNKGVNAMLFADQVPYYIQHGVKYADVTAILETNHKNLANWEYFEHDFHKRRRAYIKEI